MLNRLLKQAQQLSLAALPLLTPLLVGCSQTGQVVGEADPELPLTLTTTTYPAGDSLSNAELGVAERKQRRPEEQRAKRGRDLRETKSG